jgi:hypothetical protein
VRTRNLIIAAAAVVAGGLGPTPAMATMTPGPSIQSVDLTVIYRSAPGEAARTMHLVCDPPGGDQPRAGEACAALADVHDSGRNPFQKPDDDRVCAVEYAGPQTAYVAGRWRGASVHASFARTNGCETARWNLIEPVLDPGPPA